MTNYYKNSYKKYYEKHKEKLLEDKKIYYEKNKEKIKNYQKNKYVKKPKLTDEEKKINFKKSVKKWQSQKLNCIHCNKKISYVYENTHLKKYCKYKTQKKDDEDDNKSISSLELD